MVLQTQFFLSCHDTSALTGLENLAGYRRWFMDADLWHPFVRNVCQRHRLLPYESIRPGLAGTCPTFVVNESWVVKFFGRLFDGEISFKVEQICAQLLAENPILPVPDLLGMGNLQDDPGEGWHWPYLIFRYLPGISFGEVSHQVSFQDKVAMARMLGEGTRRLHRLPLPSNCKSSLLSCDELFLKLRPDCTERQRVWGSLPVHLLGDVESFLQTTDSLTNPFHPPGLIHADLTRDHILGRLENGAWHTLGIIDFGDAMIGYLPYELIALHLDLFAGDKHLLKAYLEAYELEAECQTLIPLLAMRASLLHQFNIWEGLFRHIPQAYQAASLEELALLTWDVSNLADL